MADKKPDASSRKSVRRSNSQRKRSGSIVPTTPEEHERDRAAAIQFTHENFYNIDGYRAVVHAVDKAAPLCEQLAKCVHERAHIEKQYAASLRAFAERWKTKVSCNTESGTMRLAFASIGEQANHLAETKLKSYDDICDEIQGGILTYSETTYKKKISGYVRTKTAHEAFKQAQKEYAKLHAKLSKHMKQYYQSCALVHKRKAYLTEADANSAVEPKEIERIRQQIKKAQKMTGVMEAKYRKSLARINDVCDNYMQAMRDAYAQPAEWQKDRVQNMRKLMLNFVTMLNNANSSDAASLSTMERRCEGIDPNQDEASFSASVGPDQSWDRPSFREYEEGLGSRTALNTDTTAATAASRLVATAPSPLGGAATGSADDYEEPPDAPPPMPSVAAAGNNSGEGLNAQWGGAPPSAPPLDISSKHSSMSDADDADTDWGSREWDDDGQLGAGPVDPQSTKVLRYTRAIYDYTGAETDELSFKEDDIIEVYAEEDESGWCRGNLKGAEAGSLLFPGLYTEPATREHVAGGNRGERD